MTFRFWLVLTLALSFGFAYGETYFANVENDTVTNVIVADQSFVDSLDGDWVQTFRDQPNETYAGIGFHYNSTTGDFSAPDQGQPDALQHIQTTLSDFVESVIDFLASIGSTNGTDTQ